MIISPAFKLLSSLLPIIHVTNAAILSVSPGDASDLKSKFSAACNGDVVLIPPGVYSIDENLCSYQVSSCTNPSKDIILRGNSSDATKTKLVGVSLRYCEGYIVIDNLSLNSGTCENGAFLEDDSDKGIILRNCIVNTPYKDAGTVSIDIMSQRIGFINTVIQNPFLYPDSQKNGLVEEGKGLVMINSKMTGFKTALDLKFHGSKNVTNFIDILRFDSFSNPPLVIPGPFVPVQIYFSAVKTAGETTVYRLPSAYPSPPLGLKTAAGAVQYYQFDSTAALSGAATVYFEKSAIDAEFIGSTTIKVYFHNGITWAVLSTSVVNLIGKNFYRFTFPSTVLLSGLVGFFST